MNRLRLAPRRRLFPVLFAGLSLVLLPACSSAPLATYDLTPDRNDPARWKVVVDGGSLGAGFENGFRYRVYGGRTWSKQYRINLVDRPVIVSVNTAVRFSLFRS